MSIHNYLSFAILWMGLAASGARTVSFTFDDGPTLDQTPLMTPAERNEAFLRNLRDGNVQAMFFVTLKERRE